MPRQSPEKLRLESERRYSKSTTKATQRPSLWIWCRDVFQCKVVRDGEVLDIRVVWNLKSNGYNEQVWVPGCMLPTWQDAKNMVCKWLHLPMGRYLALGSPEQDYTLGLGTLHVLDQGDIDVGEMFHNYMIHESERHALGIRHVQTETDEGMTEETRLRRFN